MITSTPHRKYVCDKCSKTYTRVTSLRNHERTHTGERPHRCEKCDETFMTKDVLRTHMAVHLPADAKITCPACGTKFTRISSLKRHEKHFCTPIDADAPDFSQPSTSANPQSGMPYRDSTTYHPDQVLFNPNDEIPATSTRKPPTFLSTLKQPDGEISDEVIRDVLKNGSGTMQFWAMASFRQCPQKTWWVAADLGHLRALKMLVERCSMDVNLPEMYTGQTALHYAAKAGHHLAVTELLRMRANVDARDRHQETPLFKAVYWQHAAAVQTLLDHKADIEVSGRKGLSPLKVACEGSGSDILNMLLDQLNNPASVIETLHLLHRVIRSQDASAKKLSVLFDLGADVTTTTEDGNTILHTAAKSRNLLCMQKIFGKVNLVQARNQLGQTPLHCLLLDDNSAYLQCWRRGLHEVTGCLDLLLSYGSDVNCISANGQTTFTMLVTHFTRFIQSGVLDSEFREECDNICELLRILFNYNANIFLEVQRGITILDLIHQEISKSYEQLKKENELPRYKTFAEIQSGTKFKQLTLAVAKIERIFEENMAINTRGSLRVQANHSQLPFLDNSVTSSAGPANRYPLQPSEEQTGFAPTIYTPASLPGTYSADT